MSTLGYKLGMFNGMELVEDFIHLDENKPESVYINGSKYLFINGVGYLKNGSALKEARWKNRIYYALITLEIPDNAVRSTPDIRDNILKHAYLPIPEREIFSRLEMRALFEGTILELMMTVSDRLNNILFDFSPYTPMDLNKFHSVISDSKCRCSEAKVIKVELLEPDGYITYAYTFNNLGAHHYKLGEMVYPDKWDTDLMEQCSNGIHYFEDPRYALTYGLWFYPGFIKDAFENCDYIMKRYF